MMTVGNLPREEDHLTNRDVFVGDTSVVGRQVWRLHNHYSV